MSANANHYPFPSLALLLFITTPRWQFLLQDIHRHLFTLMDLTGTTTPSSCGGMAQGVWINGARRCTRVNAHA